MMLLIVKEAGIRGLNYHKFSPCKIIVKEF